MTSSPPSYPPPRGPPPVSVLDGRHRAILNIEKAHCLPECLCSDCCIGPEAKKSAGAKSNRDKEAAGENDANGQTGQVIEIPALVNSKRSNRQAHERGQNECRNPK